MYFDTSFNCKTGIEYENQIVSILGNLRFKANRVGKNDGGVDIFASITLNSTNYNYNIQCKYFNRQLGKEPVQEVFTGTHYYNNGAIPVVITNNSISSEARLYAKKLGVEIIADIEWVEIQEVLRTQMVVNRNHDSLMMIMLSQIVSDKSLIPIKSSDKTLVQSDDEDLRLEILSNYEIAKELSREAIQLRLDAYYKEQESIRLQRENRLKNSGYT